MTWITDSDNNRCSVEYWGSEDAARAALATLKGCSRCSDCSDCSGCSRCSRCSRCSDCSDCSGCSHCSDCSDCSRCSGCSRLVNAAPVADTVQPILVPVVPNLHKRIYEAVTQPDALDMVHWHTCATTHCRAGWVVTLAGDGGKRMEERFGTSLAAMKIYDASCPGFTINPCRFHDSNEDALADMKRLAESEE